MKISIIIPCYNVEDYISPLLGSILKQIEGKDVEVICVNDGSTDRTLSILESFSSKNSSLHIINQENSGTASARNSGLTTNSMYFLKEKATSTVRKSKLSLPHTSPRPKFGVRNNLKTKLR